MRVLLVEDDVDLSRSILSDLRSEGIDAAGAPTIARFLGVTLPVAEVDALVP